MTTIAEGYIERNSMLKNARSTCVFIAFATTFIVASGSQDQKRPGPPVPKKTEDDILGEALHLADQRLARDFEIRDALEWKLVGLRAGDPAVPRVGGTVISIVIVRSGDKEEISKVHEKRIDDRWVMRFRRVVTTEIKSPVAVISAAYMSGGRPQLRERILWADRTSEWHEWPSDGE